MEALEPAARSPLAGAGSALWQTGRLRPEVLLRLLEIQELTSELQFSIPAMNV